MRLRIRHRIHQRFAEPARNVTRVLRLTPRSHEGQHVIKWRVDVDVDCVLKAGEDGFGNLTHTFTAKGPTEAVTVAVSGEADNFDAAGVVRGSAERLPVELYLRETALTPMPTAVRDFARQATGAASSTLGRLHLLQDALNDAVAFEAAHPGPPDAPAALAAGRGGGRDIAHLFAASARVLGIPARVTSGYYLLPDQTSGICHAWAEAFVDGLGWTAFDAAHRVCPQERHVRLATGLDYLAAAMIRGSGEEETTETLDISAPYKVGWSQSQWQGAGGQGQSQRQGGQSQSQSQG